MKKILACFALLLLSACGGSSSDTGSGSGFNADFYASEFNQSTDSTLYQMDSSNGSVQVVGNVAAQITDIALLDGVLYAVSFSDLYTLNQLTGDATLIGATGFENTNALAGDAGVLYAANTDGDFYSLNLTTGASTLIGNFGSGMTSSGDIAFDEDGNLFASVNVGSVENDSLAQVNVSSGVASLLGETGLDKVYGLAVKDSTLYGTLFDGALVTLSNTGVATRIAQDNSFFARTGEFSNSVNVGGLTAIE
jgi:hypothetical protein